MAEQERLYALWHITRACNLNCKYCCSPNKNMHSPVVNIQRLSKALREHGREWTIHMSGGEPFLYPDFIGVCRELTKEFRIKVNSNLIHSTEVRAFSNLINPDKVELILASLHIEEMERLGMLEDFIGNVLLLKERGFKVIVKFVLHPTLIERFQGDCRYFDSRGIKLSAKPFQGVYQGKRYPKAYPDNVKNIFSNNAHGSAFYPFCFKGINCSAGRLSVHIESDGLVTRCLDDLTILGNIHDGFKLKNTASPCRSYRCSCFGYDLIAERPFARQATNFNLLHQILSDLKYVNREHIFSRLFSFAHKKIQPGSKVGA